MYTRYRIDYPFNVPKPPARDPTLLAEVIAERLSALPSLPREDEKAVLTACSTEAAKTFEKYLPTKAKGTQSASRRRWRGGRPRRRQRRVAARRPPV
jgi:hypothetical protein